MIENKYKGITNPEFLQPEDLVAKSFGFGFIQYPTADVVPIPSQFRLFISIPICVSHRLQLSCSTS